MSQKQPERGTGFFGHVTDEDLNHKLNQVLGLLQVISQKENAVMADLTNLNTTVAKLQTDVAALLAKAGTDDQAAVDAITATLTTLDTQIETFLNPPAAPPAG